MDNLIKVGSSRFKIAEAYRFSSADQDLPKSMEFDHIIYAAAKFGGPIAITADPGATILISSATSLIIDNIYIFRSNGELLQQIRRSDLHKTLSQASNPRIVGMDFLPDETLFVISRQGVYSMIDPLTGSIRVYTLREVFYEENIVQAKVIGRTIIFFTNPKGAFYKFYFIRDIENPAVQEFSHSEIKSAFYDGNLNKIFFLPIPPSCSFSSKIECFVTHHKLGAYRLIEDETDKYEFVNHIPSSTFKKLPEIKEVECMALTSPEGLKPRKMALLNTFNVLYLITVDASTTSHVEIKIPMLGELSQEAGSEKKLYWCGDKALAIACGRYYVLVTTEGEYKRQTNRSGSFVMIPELDSLRIFSSDKCEILRRVPERYIQIFLPTSKAKAADLYNAYLETVEMNLSPENNIIEDKRGLEEAVNDLLDAAYFEVNAENQMTLLRAAGFGKTFLSKSNSTFRFDKFAEVCKNLRVVNSLKTCKIARIVTYSQFRYLDSRPEYFMDILMRYRLFYLANEIANFLSYDKELISRIYTTWACCKIEQQASGDENIAEKIFERLKNDENASYVEVAHKAFMSASANDRTRKDLALKIIQYEPCVQKKVTFLLWIENYEQALLEASRSLDPNLVDLVILKLSKDPDAGLNFWKMVSENPRARPRLFRHIYEFKHQRIKKRAISFGKNKEVKTENKEDMDQYLEKFSTNDERAAHFLWRCFVEQYETEEEFKDPKDQKIKISKKLEPLSIEEKTALIDRAQKLKIKSPFLMDTLAMFKTYLKEDKAEKPIVDVIKDKVMVGKDTEVVKRYKVSDRIAFLAKLKTLIEQPDKFRQYEAIEKLLEEKNKKGDLVSYFDIVNMLVEHGITDKAEKYALRIKNWDEQLFMLKYIGTTTALNTAIDQAIAQKKFDDLVDLGKYVEQISSSPNKYPNIKGVDPLREKIEKAFTLKK